MGYTILIAEDYSDIREMTRIMLESIGCKVIEARDGGEAIARAKETHPDLILMDIAMPMINGITAARIIKADAGCSEIPIVAVTAYGKEYARADDFGFDQVVAKPVDIEEFKAIVSRYIQ